ncbi:hypothetical protein BZG36_01633 [Bifiguratus adelaidae]|uniref:non-specific serine/threonine protein kinase n=1 Tax=Bifiguratus adelaidae TaxID=1938954 RepID=A0A261Y4B4_9FUNG|nr:hypothetical protein BZG36_01633 [Bifiguratus adelaidae]
MSDRESEVQPTQKPPEPPHDPVDRQRGSSPSPIATPEPQGPVASNAFSLSFKKHPLLKRMLSNRTPVSTPPLQDSDTEAASNVQAHQTGPNTDHVATAQAVNHEKTASQGTTESSAQNTGSRRFELLDNGEHRHHLSTFHFSKLKTHNFMNLFHRDKYQANHFHLPLPIRDEKGTAAGGKGPIQPDDEGIEGNRARSSVEDDSNNTKAHGNLLQANKSPELSSEGANSVINGTSFAEKWGTCQEVIGKGAFGVVRITHKVDASVPGSGERLYAVKEFRKRHFETNKAYIKRLTSEFCISSTLHHENIVKTLDLLPIAASSPTYCEVMEFCAGGDIYGLIIGSHGGLQVAEADCFFKQLVRGVHYLHKMGVAHRDLKPENLLLTPDGCLKITDFGNSECFRMAWESEAHGVHASKGVCGSEPYIAPEEFGGKEFDPRLVDVWSIGVIYLAMLTGQHMWRIAQISDGHYSAFLERRLEVRAREEAAREARRREKEGEKVDKGDIPLLSTSTTFKPIDKLSEGARRLVYKILEPDPRLRVSTVGVAKDPYFKKIWCCQRDSMAEFASEKAKKEKLANAAVPA